MKLSQRVIVATLLGASFSDRNVVNADDKFNYRATSGDDYGPEDWDEVSCSSLENCDGWPNKLLNSIGWELKSNECEHCPIEGNSCGQHRQSPIDLHRDRAIADHENWKECPDWHWMQYEDGACKWEDMTGQFEIARHALQLHMPIRSNGDIDCENEDGDRRYPRLDYSKGFPDWWYLSRTDISVPSQHVQQGKRYAAEVVLSHVYEEDHYKNKLGKVSIFMQDFEGEQPWHYLDKLICQWRKKEEEKRAACGLDPAPVYRMCELYRGQVRGDDDYDNPGDNPSFPTRAPLVSPDPIPIQDLGSNPLESQLPLQLCQGDCDSTTDCATGLICEPRNANETVTGCIGGENDPTNSDYCVFDPFGEGYTPPSEMPTMAPTATPRPSLTPPAPKPLVDFGGSPPAEKFPLQLCQGDCDKNSHCAEGLICFQRDENQTVPGCIGGETDIKKSDYCIFDPYGPGYDPVPTGSPTLVPTASHAPSSVPSSQPSRAPVPGTPVPSSEPSGPPSGAPSQLPSTEPTAVPVPSSMPTYYTRPTGPMLSVTDLGWQPETPLGECQGDCDLDSDCGPGMICYQRNTLRAPVPGCLGGEDDATLTDYCTYRPLPSNAPTSNPVDDQTDTPTGPPNAPTSNPSDRPTSDPTTLLPTSLPTVYDGEPIALKSFGWTPGKVLGRCEGDCDTDEDCGVGLVCFQRNVPKTPVPGCTGGDEDGSSIDYCIVDPATLVSSSPTSPASGFPTASPTTATPSRKPTSTPSMSPSGIDSENPSGSGSSRPTNTESVTPTSLPTPEQSLAPTGAVSNPPTTSSGNLPIKDLGWTPPEESLPLKQCEGDCDNNGDCEGELICFQRYTPKTPVPGCSGGEMDGSLIDYCTVDNTKLAPTPSPSTTSTTTKPSALPSVTPASAPPSTSPNSAPPAIDCAAYDNEANFRRMCKDDSCCESTRDESQFCHESYSFLGDLVESACYHCCLEENGVPKEVGPAPVLHQNITKTVECDQLESAERMCKAGGCCHADGVDSDFCQEQLELWPGALESICWYCCHPSIFVDFEYDGTNRRTLADEKTSELEEEEQLREGDMVTHNVQGQRIIIRAENFGEKGLEDEEAYFDEIFRAFQRREEETPLVENYDDVHWWPYEWLVKVGTEYYFRYEGTQTVPPCYDTAHWRVLKDPIRVAPHQMRELERLMAWRLGDSCQVDTAGKPREGNPDAVDVNRPLQSYHTLHRKVFCECQDWPSKFPRDREWCRNWRDKPPEQRLFERPYNWPSDGF